MSSAGSNLSIDVRQNFLMALRRVLRPIVRMMIRSGIRYDEFADAARRAYVEGATELAGKDASAPRSDKVAWITGIDPQQIDHYGASSELPPVIDTRSTDVAVEALHQWHTDPHYLDPSGQPCELEFRAPAGPSFEELVMRIGASSSAESILERLLQSKSVVLMEDGRIRAISRRFVWPEDVISSPNYWGITLARAIETHEYNFTTPDVESKRLERSVFADHGISERVLIGFQSFSHERADQFLFDLDDWLGQHPPTSADESAPRVEVSVSVFFYVEPHMELVSTHALVQPRRRSNAHGDE